MINEPKLSSPFEKEHLRKIESELLPCQPTQLYSHGCALII